MLSSVAPREATTCCTWASRRWAYGSVSASNVSREAPAARAAREIFSQQLFCPNFMYFLRFEHGFHVQAKLYPPGVQ